MFNTDDDMHLKVNYRAGTLSQCFGLKKKKKQPRIDKWFPVLLICMTKKKTKKKEAVSDLISRAVSRNLGRLNEF